MKRKRDTKYNYAIETMAMEPVSVEVRADYLPSTEQFRIKYSGNRKGQLGIYRSFYVSKEDMDKAFVDSLINALVEHCAAEQGFVRACNRGRGR